jgi:threonylcarbamoyladenosine tRNA methylthiotransferase MtaB
MYSVSFFTLGCKLNQLETEALAGAFREEGFTVGEALISGPSSEAHSSPPELCIINTCTVTSKADQKARRIIRLFLRRGSTVVVTGCYAQLDGAELAALEPGTDLFIVPGRAKDSLLDLPFFLKSHHEMIPSRALALWQEERGRGQFAGEANVIEASPAPFRFHPRNFSFHSRAFLKIQDGCNRNCAYCRVPLARGKSISLDAAELIRRIKVLEDAGFPEAVLTGVNICQYRDPDNGTTLPVLLRMLLENTNHIALRLSSIEPEPEILGDDFFKILAHERIRNHFHLSVQSGSSGILSAMGRPYSGADILKTVDKLRNIKDDPFLACDIITGFPGETEEDFEATAALCRKADFAWIHGFPFSPRKGTRAASMKGQISQRKAGKRLELLLAMARQGRRAYIQRWLGKTVNAVAETGFFPPFFPALADNYIRLLVSKTDGTGPEPGFAFRCRIREEITEKTCGEKQERSFDALGEVI